MDTAMPNQVSTFILPSCASACLGASFSGDVPASSSLFFHFFRSLPEEQVGTDRRAEDRDDRR